MGNIAMQLVAQSLNTPVMSSEAVPFNTIEYTAGDVDYDINTGVVSLSQPGRYIVHWWLSTHSSISPNGAVFALVSSTSGQKIGNSPIKTGEVYGFGIFTVEDELNPIQLSLQNISQSAFYFTQQTPIQGSLMITEDTPIEEGVYAYAYTPYNSVGWGAEAGAEIVLMENGPLLNTSHLIETSQINILEDGNYEVHYTFVILELAYVTISIAVNGNPVPSTEIPIGQEIGEFSNSAILALTAGDVVGLYIS